MPSPFDVDPRLHRGEDRGPLARLFVFMRRRADDHLGPTALPREDDWRVIRPSEDEPEFEAGS